jgi:CRP-like cAMP-binding protein
MAFLDAFDAAETKTIIDAGTRLTVPEGWSPISQSTGADKLYIIESGEVSVRKDGQQVATLTAGDVMGERAILDKTLRTASLVTLTRLEVIHLTDEAVRDLCERMPKFRTELENAAQAHTRELSPDT